MSDLASLRSRTASSDMIDHIDASVDNGDYDMSDSYNVSVTNTNRQPGHHGCRAVHAVRLRNIPWSDHHLNLSTWNDLSPVSCCIEAPPRDDDVDAEVSLSQPRDRVCSECHRHAGRTPQNDESPRSALSPPGLPPSNPRSAEDDRQGKSMVHGCGRRNISQFGAPPSDEHIGVVVAPLLDRVVDADRIDRSAS